MRIPMPWHELRPSGVDSAPRSDAGPQIRALGALQHGVLARWQLLELGVPAHVVRYAVRSGGLIRLRRGVYAVGHAALSTNGWLMMAVLAAGEDTAVSHRTATHEHGLRVFAPALIEVTRAGGPLAIPGVTVHRTRAWHLDDVVLLDGVPITSVCRSIVDFADVGTAQALDSVFAQAEIRQLDVSGLDAAVERVRGRTGPGPARLREARERLAALGIVLTRSEGEELLRRLLDDAGLRPPQMNCDVAGDELDAGWPDVRVGIELDSWRYRRGRVRFVRDRAKLRRMTLAGWTILPFTGQELVHQPQLVAREAGLLLACGRAGSIRGR
ncbi:MAG: hypothetical protein JWM31_2653 [Solirubrobacterales bacterium]|nr:hypothetical protein [Solirubrobacterales bacterium]